MGYNAAWLVTNILFRQGNDFVVNTNSMFGGITRQKNCTWYVLEENARVNHVNYFSRPESARRMEEAIFLPNRLDNTGLGKISQIGDFHLLENGKPSTTNRAGDAILDKAGTDDGNLPVLFLLPGIMGSCLRDGEEDIWVDYWQLFNGGMSRLQINNNQVSADGLHRASYNDFINTFSRSYEVIDFSYDWRRSVKEAATNLAKAIEIKFDELDSKAHQSGAPPNTIRIVAHSMGGLVVRALALVAPDVWSKLIAQPDFRFMMLGTPNTGSYAMVRALVGHNKILKNVAFIDRKNKLSDITKIIAKYPGVSDLLPTEGNGKWYTDEQWRKISRQIDRAKEDALAVPAAGLRNLAESFHSQLESVSLNTPELDGKVIYVAGKAKSTPNDLKVVDGEIEFPATADGDGSVTWESGIPEGVEAWFVDVEHGKLADDKRYFPAYADLLATGTTAGISTQRPKTRGDVGPLRSEDETIEYFNARTIDQILFGDGVTRSLIPATKQRKVDVKVIHGNLKFVVGDIFAGHYKGDTIAGSESAANSTLSGLLDRSRLLDTYPGNIETSRHFEAEGFKVGLSGAVIVGLGQIGDLTPANLKRTLIKAYMRYLESISRVKAEASQGVTINTILIGSGSSGLPLSQSITSHLDAVIEVNKTIAELEFYDGHNHIPPHISAINIIELYKDVALSSVYALSTIINNSRRYASVFQFKPELINGSGGKSRVYKAADESWWNFIGIRMSPDRRLLIFKVISGTAGTYEFKRVITPGLVETFMQSATQSTSWDENTAITLFEILLPKELKEHAFEQQHIKLLLDEHTAGYPWELIEDRLNQDSTPLGVRVGLIRQLINSTVNTPPKYVNEDKAIVIGDPKLDPDSGFMPLHGAREEAEEVITILSGHGFEVKSAVHQNFHETMSTLEANDCKILHLAGHGIHEVEITSHGEEIRSGMVLDNGQYISASNVANARYVPEVVFINCCYLGLVNAAQPVHNSAPHAEELALNQMAASISREFIKMGAKVVVAAGWAVEDKAAKVFAQEFYRCMLADGRSFGEAVKVAREAAFRASKFSNTWGAYQCYGDPAFRLVNAGGRSYKTSSPVYTADEVIVRLQNIVQDCKSGIGGTDQEALEKIQDIENYSDQNGWLEKPALMVALGLAYGEIHEFEKATGWLDRAKEFDSHALGYRESDECENFRARWAFRLFKESLNTNDRREKAKLRRRAENLIEKAVENLEFHLVLRDNDFRMLQYLGSSYKRAAVILGYRSTVKCRENVEAAYQFYDEAHDILARRQQNNIYPGVQSLYYKLLYYWLYEQDISRVQVNRLNNEVTEALRALDEKSHAENNSSPTNDFWTTMHVSDIKIAELLLPNENPSNFEVDKLYEADIGSNRQYASIVDHLDVLSALLGIGARSNNQAVILRKEKIDQIRRRLVVQG